MKKSKVVLIIVAVVLIVIQFFQIDKTNTPEVAEITFNTIEHPPEKVMTLLQNACFDCHSDQTEYPWYASIQPVAWWLRSHIRGAKMHMNFSTWGNESAEDRQHMLKEAAEEIEEGEMPPGSFQAMHPEAKLTAEETELLINWLSQAGK